METEYPESFILELEPAEAVKMVLYPVLNLSAFFTLPYHQAMVAAVVRATPRPVLRITLPPVNICITAVYKHRKTRP